RYMIKHLEYLLDPNTEPGAAGGQPGDLQGSVLVKLRDRFMLTVFSCIQLASKLALHCHIIDNNVGVSFLQSMGYNYTKETLLESELHILKTLDFCISIPNPLTYVEMLLEVLGYNDSSVPVPQMHTVCQQVLQFIYLQRNAIYHHLLQAVTACPSPTVEQRVKFVTVKEDSMLLAIGVIAVGAFILRFTSWEQVTQDGVYQSSGGQPCSWRAEHPARFIDL
ncbi:CNTD1 protein, partial [Amia calva]|nr:CNTD1 protein [Amia calva]